MNSYSDLGDRYIDRFYPVDEDSDKFPRKLSEYKNYIKNCRMKSKGWEYELPPFTFTQPTKSQKKVRIVLTSN